MHLQGDSILKCIIVKCRWRKTACNSCLSPIKRPRGLETIFSTSTFKSNFSMNLFYNDELYCIELFYTVLFSVKQYKISCEFGLNLSVSQIDGHLGFSTVSIFQCLNSKLINVYKRLSFVVPEISTK